MRRLALRSLQNKIALLFFAITALAFSIIFFFIVPQLRSELEDQRKRDVEREAGQTSGALERVMGGDIRAQELNELVRAVADRADADVTLLGVQRSGPGREELRFYVISDSRTGADVAVDEPLARQAIRRRKVVTAGNDQVVRAAEPLNYRGRTDWVAVYSRSLDEVTDAVDLIRSQVLLAGALALIVALLGGYGIARTLARRVNRVERAARQVASGSFIEPLPIDSVDELGQLARTFNDMQRQLEQVDRARKDFIANASHELRTPIFSLSGFVELLQDEDVDPATREEFLASMAEQVERLQKLASDLLDLSRLDAGSLQVGRERVDLAELARGVVDEFRPRSAPVHLRLPDARVDASCDPERVAQIMRILLDNALRHTPDGTDVTVAAASENGRAELSVADRGPGLRAEEAERVFDRFYTADAARGSGLGLAIARELAERMDGRIVLQTEPGRTVFTLELPAGTA